jgi:alpha,alpha-trehalase
MNLEAVFGLCVGSGSVRVPVRRLCRSVAILALCQVSVFAQVAATATPPSAPAAATIDQYIHQAWDTLSRSMTDCNSLIDPKLKTAPVLYIPQEIEEPPQVAALHSKCNVDVERLPQRITHIGEVDPRSIKVPGLLYLPNKYVVPGGRFNEMYGWDSYFILLGLLRDGRVDIARGMAAF